jgi:hypothetical protein
MVLVGTTIDMLRGYQEYITMDTPVRPIDRRALRNCLIPDADGKAARVAAAAGSAHSLASCPSRLFFKRDKDGRTPAACATWQGHPHCLKVCPVKSLSVGDKFYRRPVHIAASLGMTTCLRVMPKETFFLRTTRDYTAAHCAADFGQAKALRICGRIAPETFTLQVAQLMYTPAHVAARKLSGDCLRVCFDIAPESLKQRDHLGKTPEDLLSSILKWWRM